MTVPIILMRALGTMEYAAKSRQSSLNLQRCHRKAASYSCAIITQQLLLLNFGSRFVNVQDLEEPGGHSCLPITAAVYLSS
jgi:hypothetical protein